MINFQTFFAYHPEDTEEIRVEKFSIFLVAGSCTLAGCVWAAMYYFIFGLSLTTLLPLSFALFVGGSLIISHFTKNHYYAVYTQIVCIMYITTLIQWNIGGVFESGFVFVWAFIGPMIALMFFSLRKSLVWYFLFLINLVITVVFDDFFTQHGYTVADTIKSFFFIMNFGFSSLIVFVFAGYFVNAAIEERKKANRLLLNVLPKKIAEILKTSDDTIADRFDSVSVLFADIVGSTPLFADIEPTEAVDWLNEAFSALDDLVEKHGLEKIRTIGDSYMVAAGVPTHREGHAKVMAMFAIDMLAELENFPARNGKRLEFRVGINSGPLVAGVIGKSKFHYDIWGDTVNVASRMESHGETGKTQISKNTYELIKDDFECVSRGNIPIKGKGEMETWFLVGARG